MLPAAVGAPRWSLTTLSSSRPAKLSMVLTKLAPVALNTQETRSMRWGVKDFRHGLFARQLAAAVGVDRRRGVGLRIGRRLRAIEDIVRGQMQ